jgi:UDP-N-acetylmuramate dehydrogenase
MRMDISSNRDLDGALGILKERFGSRITVDRQLSDLTSFGTGGRARIFMEVRTAEELQAAVKIAGERRIPFFMMGGGSNLLISDSGYEGFIIKNSIKGMEVHGQRIAAGAGENLGALVDFAAENSFSGLEFAAGIWGTVGGAIFGNAGAYGGDMGNILESAELIDRQGNIRLEKKTYFEFDYRFSKLRATGELVSRATFALKRGKKSSIMSRIDEILADRRRKLPLDKRSAGCFFRNIPDPKEKFGKLAAGRLLEEIGAKKMSFGDARVWNKHANIIINDGAAKSEDIRKLAALLKSRVKDKFGIELQEEVIFLGKFEE